jgi:hypothetical protein
VDISKYEKKSSKKLWGGFTPKIRGNNGIKEQLKRHDSLKLSLYTQVEQLTWQHQDNNQYQTGTELVYQGSQLLLHSNRLNKTGSNGENKG